MSRIHPTAQIDASARLGDDVEIGPYCVIGADVVLGAHVTLASHVVLEGPMEIGAGVQIHAFAALGGPPQIKPYFNPAQTRLEIGPNCVIREHVTMNRGSQQGLGVTRVGRDCLFMAQAHVGHDCQVGDRVVLAQGATLGGHAHIGDEVVLGGLSAVHQRARIGRLAMVGGMVGVYGDIIPFGLSAGERGCLSGLNRVGMRRSGMSGAVVRLLGSLYTELFHGEGLFADRLDKLAQNYEHVSEAMEIVHFLRVPRQRPLVPARRAWQTGPGLE